MIILPCITCMTLKNVKEEINNAFELFKFAGGGMPSSWFSPQGSRQEEVVQREKKLGKGSRGDER